MWTFVRVTNWLDAWKEWVECLHASRHRICFDSLTMQDSLAMKKIKRDSSKCQSKVTFSLSVSA